MGSYPVTAALGRKFRLGMLYDARTDQLLQGNALWDSAVLKSMTRTSPQPHSHFRLSSSDSAEEKASLLEIQASLRASALCGFVEGEGSAKFLHDKQQFKNQSRVILQYKASTHFEQLSLTAGDWDNMKDRDMVQRGLATHVVTGIEYGGNVFFVFDSHVVQESELQEFKLKVKAVIHLIFFSHHFNYDEDLTEEQKSIAEKLTVKCYSDFLLEQSPATLAEAVQTYRDMSKLLGEHGESSVPVRVWMVPVTHLNPAANGLVSRHISVGLVLEAEETLEDLDSFIMRSNECLSVSAVGKFPELQQQVHRFSKLCQSYSVELQRQMAETCPAIREGTVEESVLRSLFDQRLKSPFSQDRLTKWLEDKEREVSVVQSCLDVMEGVPLLSTQAEVDRFVLGERRSVCSGYIFTSLQSPDSQLDEMETCVEHLRMRRSYEQPVEVSGQPWFYCDDTVSKMRATAEAFAKTADAVFIRAEQREQHRGAAVLHYRDTRLVSLTKLQDFSKS